MPFTIKINSVEKIPGPYTMYEVNYNYKDKQSTKKLAGFGKLKKVAEALVGSNEGDNFTITTEKNDKGFMDWIDARPASGSVYHSPQRNNYNSSKPSSSSDSKVQLYIVRQSSMQRAVEILTAKGVPFGTEDVTAVADELVKYVFSEPDLTSDSE
jgi:hypothetical protein